MNERNQRHVLACRSRRFIGMVSSIVLPAALALAAAPFAAEAYGVQTGKASWYGPGFHGKKTASGERFNQHALTAAHRSLPLGTRARVTNLKNGKVVLVKINDRGPYHGGRVIDLSRAAARHLALSGLSQVRIEAMP